MGVGVAVVGDGWWLTVGVVGWSRVYREPQGINYVYATLTATEQTIVTAASSSC